MLWMLFLLTNTIKIMIKLSETVGYHKRKDFSEEDFSEIKNKIRGILGDYALNTEYSILNDYQEIIEKFTIKHFGRLPYENYFYNQNVGDFIVEDMKRDEGECLSTHKDDDDAVIEVDWDETLNNVLKEYPDSIVISKGNEDQNKLGECSIFNDDFIFYGGVFYMDKPKLPLKINNCLVKYKPKSEIRWVLRTARGNISIKKLNIIPKGKIVDNYNDDFIEVDKKINNIIKEKSSSILILHGKPGTGKTSYIRNLISNNNDINFYWLDSTMFNYMDSAEFVEFIADCKNSVFILEDCEALLKSRENGANIAMQSLLNISDGILGDSLNLKFICTFNTNIFNIDKALLRKGRMKFQYEFKELCKEKVEIIFEKMGIDKSFAKSMPLCDVYNFRESNGVKEKNKIGF